MITPAVKSFLEHQQIVGSWRGNCPECGGENTFSVRSELGRLFFTCFRASCIAVGSTKADVNCEELERQIVDFSRVSLEYLHASVGRARDGVPDSAFVVPDYWQLAHQHEKSWNLVVEFDCEKPYMNGRADIRYDPKENRVVFLIGKAGVYSGAVGRSLSPGVQPKWHNYHKHHQEPYIVPVPQKSLVAKVDPYKQGCIVEDAISATRISCAMDGIGLLGTVLNETYIPYLVAYNRLVIALDKDASSKSIDMSRYLQWFVPNVDIILLERDLKYENEERVKEILCSY